jgi:hypothetical protein
MRTTVVALVAAILTAVSQASAQLPGSPPDTARVTAADSMGFWGTVGGGFATAGGDVFGHVGFTVRRNRLTLGLRREVASDWVNDRHNTKAHGATIGLIGRKGPGFATLSAGLSHVTQTGYFDQQQGAQRRSVGLMINGGASLRLGREAGIGLGLTYAGNFNPLSPFSAVAVELLIGKW